MTWWVRSVTANYSHPPPRNASVGLTAIARRADSPPCRAALDAVQAYRARGGSPEAIDESLRTYAAFVAREHDLAARHAERKP